MKRFIVLCTTAAMLFAVVSCTGSSSNQSADAPGTYLASNGSEITFIQWRHTADGHVQGTLTANSIGGAAPAASLSVDSVPFTGTVHGTSVNLTFAHDLFLRSSANGSLTGSSLTLAVPRADGQINRTTFTQSSHSSYNRAVAALRRSAQHENLQARQADSHASASGRAVQHNTQTDLASLYQVSSLAPQAKLTHDVDYFARDVATARYRLATEKQAASGDNHYCAASSTVVGVSQGVSGTVLAAHGGTEAMTADITAISMDIRAANADVRRLSRARLPEPTSAPALIASARASMAQAIASANANIDQINAINYQAHVFANHMATGKCSSAGQAALPQPVAHIK